MPALDYTSMANKMSAYGRPAGRSAPSAAGAGNLGGGNVRPGLFDDAGRTPPPSPPPMTSGLPYEQVSQAPVLGSAGLGTLDAPTMGNPAMPPGQPMGQPGIDQAGGNGPMAMLFQQLLAGQGAPPGSAVAGTGTANPGSLPVTPPPQNAFDTQISRYGQSPGYGGNRRL